MATLRQTFSEIADAIREKTGGTETYKIAQSVKRV